MKNKVFSHQDQSYFYFNKNCRILSNVATKNIKKNIKKSIDSILITCYDIIKQKPKGGGSISKCSRWN